MPVNIQAFLWSSLVGRTLIVMAGEACPGEGRGPAIHVFVAGTEKRRGWSAFADHDNEA
jgi:hypothetical protein